MSNNTTWRIELTEAFASTGDTWEDITASTLTEAALDTEFYPGYGSPEGEAFTVWTEKCVYFPWQYDGSEGVAWVSRHPDNKPTYHIGS